MEGAALGSVMPVVNTAIVPRPCEPGCTVREQVALRYNCSHSPGGAVGALVTQHEPLMPCAGRAWPLPGPLPRWSPLSCRPLRQRQWALVHLLLLIQLPIPGVGPVLGRAGLPGPGGQTRVSPAPSSRDTWKRPLQPVWL